MISSSAYDLKTELGTRATSEVNQLARIVWRGIKKLHPHARFGIPTWNDSRTRTKEQVLEVLDYLIAEGEAGRA